MKTKKIIDYYGRNIQLFVIMEEMSELVKSITKYERGITQTNDDITEELADVIIVLDYVKEIYNVDKRELKRIKRAKLRRLKSRVKSP